MKLKKRLTPFVDRLPILPTLKPISKSQKSTCYTVTMKEFFQKLHRDLPPTRLWGYNGMYPGPTFDVMKGEKVFVKWLNDLPAKHFLPIDTTVHGAGRTLPQTRTVVHLHGGRTPAHSDGYPEAWFTRNFKQTGPFFQRKIYEYPNIERATTLWYHDHTLGITRLNVYAGLAGFYLIRDKHELSLNLPKGKYEIPLLIQDRSFNQDGSLFYPKKPTPTAHSKKPTPTTPNLPTPSIVPEFFGDTILVNGKVWPFLEVEPRKYRFRLLNGSNARFYRLTLTSGQPFIQIGTDGGLLRSPVSVKKILLAPSERVDVIIDFSKFKGQTITLTNDAPAPFPDGVPGNLDPNTTGKVMQFRVTLPLKGKDTSSIPTRLSQIPPLPVNQARKIRNLSLVQTMDRFGRQLLLLDNKRWAAPVTENPQVGNIEIWRLINTTTDTHPIHIHLVDFRILNRQPFNVQHFNKTGKIVFTGPPVPPTPSERGRKDTVRANPGEVTRLIARFGPFTGRYVWHCHILEHEDNEMMRPFIVEGKRTKRTLPFKKRGLSAKHKST